MKKLVLALTAALVLAACSGMPKPGLPAGQAQSPAAKGAPPAALAVTASARDHVDLAIQLMGAGKAEEAEASLRSALAKSPGNATALRLLAQIETDPLALLGPASREHVIMAGDSMSLLAGRYLGDPLMFYALARYNGLAAPDLLSVGTVLKIPAPPEKAAVAAAPAMSEATLSASNPRDAEKANAARLLALQFLNEGKVERAVTLLKEAKAINPADAAIGRDLDRAMRIQAALADG